MAITAEKSFATLVLETSLSRDPDDIRCLLETALQEYGYDDNFATAAFAALEILLAKEN